MINFNQFNNRLNTIESFLQKETNGRRINDQLEIIEENKFIKFIKSIFYLISKNWGYDPLSSTRIENVAQKIFAEFETYAEEGGIEFSLRVETILEQLKVKKESDVIDQRINTLKVKIGQNLNLKTNDKPFLLEVYKNSKITYTNPQNKNLYWGPYATLRERVREDFEKLSKNGYYVFLHALGKEMAFFSDIIDVFSTKDQNYYNKKIRLGMEKPSTKAAEGINTIKVKFDENQGDDHSDRNLVISVDGNFNHFTPNEAAWRFCQDNYSVVLNGMWSGTESVEDKFKNKICPYLTKELKITAEKTKTLFEYKIIDALKLWNQYSSPFGRMTLFAIPKETVEDSDANYVYSSHPYGKKCKNGDKHQDFLSQLTKNQEGSENTCTCENRRSDINQYRLLTNFMEFDENKCVFDYDICDIEMKQQRRNIINKIHHMILSIQQVNTDEEKDGIISQYAF